MIPLYYHEDYKDYFFGRLHPFDPLRFSQFVKLIRGNEYLTGVFKIREAPGASDEELLLVHASEYIRSVHETEKTGGHLSGDTPVKIGAPNAARKIVGGTLKAVDHASQGRRAVNLGGLHHAGRDYGEGFCIFNDVAVGAEYLANKGKNVCILDTDAHQGNGTMDIFYDDPRVLFISLHQDPYTLYPGRGFVNEIGKGLGEGYTVNIPMPRDANAADYRYSMDEVVFPTVKKFKPDIIIRNGGSDPHYSDTLTDLGLDMAGLQYLGEAARKLSDENHAGHVELMLSGYGPRVIEGWLAILKGAFSLNIELPSDKKLASPDVSPDETVRNTVKELKNMISPYW
ncbi:MAG: acetoin utilization protein AcuC [Thermoplasmata archaeon]